MRRTISAVLLTLLLLAAIPFGGARTAQAADYSNVRVLLSIGSVNTLTIPFSGSYFLQENGASFSGGTLTVQVAGNQLVVSHSSKGQIYQGGSVSIMREHISPSAGSFKLATSGVTRSFLGHLTLKYYNGYIRAVNTVPLPHYLYGVVAYEMSNTFPLEALKAQAVAAKCYVLSGLAGSGDYDIGDTATDQVYKGYNSSYTNVISAVDATYNTGLYYGGRILRAYFAASNGGATILPSDAWSGTDRYQWDGAYARVTDPYDTANPETVQESLLFPANGDGGGMSAALSNYLRAVASQALLSTNQIPAGSVVVGIQAITALSVTSSSVATIAMTPVVQLADGTTTAVSLQCAFYLNDLVTNGAMTASESLRLYTVTQAANGFTLTRGRYGHGVGLSQRGAQQMAKTGWNYTQILQFYYPGASLQQMGLTAPADPVKPADTTVPSLGTPIATAVTTAAVNMREKASASSTLLGSLQKGVSLNVYAEENGFSLTQVNGVTCYVSNSYLAITPVSSDGTAQTPDTSGGTGSGTKTVVAYGTVNASTLNLRSDASTSGAVLARLTRGAALNIYGITQDGAWYYCNTSGMDGYVSAQYVALSSAPATTAPPATTGTAAASIPAGSAAVTVSDGVPLRTTPSLSGSILIGIAKGSTVTVLGEANGFYAVQYNGVQGYVSKEFLAAASTGSVPSNTDTGAGATAGSGVTTGAVNLRKGAGTSYSIIKKLAKGTELTLYSLSNGWYKVSAGGTEGYVSKDYVKETAAASGTGGGTAASAWTGVVVNEWVRMRSTPDLSTQGNIIADYAVGTKVTILAQTTNNFYQVSVNGVTGYMSKDFVQVTGQASDTSAASGSASTEKTGVTTASVYLRSGASGSKSILKTLTKGTAVTILGSSGDYYKVQAGSKTGYAVKKYISVK